MTYHIREAKHHARQIRHYYEHGGAKGYTASLYDYNTLGDLVQRAGRSKSGKNDVPLIHAIYMDMKLLMKEMKARDELDRWQDSQR
jgi:hypothetical protein